MIVIEKLTAHSGQFTLKDASFVVPTGTYGMLMGRTGSGKTTILEAIAGLKHVTGGRILLGDREVTGLKPAERNIGYVPQDGALFSTMSVRPTFSIRTDRLDSQLWRRAPSRAMPHPIGDRQFRPVEADAAHARGARRAVRRHGDDLPARRRVARRVLSVANRGRISRLHLSRPQVLPLDRLIDLLAMHRDRLWCFDSEANLVASNVNDGHHDIVANHDAFVSVAGKDQHFVLEVI